MPVYYDYYTSLLVTTAFEPRLNAAVICTVMIELLLSALKNENFFQDSQKNCVLFPAYRRL